MQHQITDLPAAEPEIGAEPIHEIKYGQQNDQHHACWNRRAFKISNLVVIAGKRFCSDIEACQPADAAANKVNQRRPVPATAQAGSETECRRSNAKGWSISGCDIAYFVGFAFNRAICAD